MLQFNNLINLIVNFVVIYFVRIVSNGMWIEMPFFCIWKWCGKFNKFKWYVFRIAGHVASAREQLMLQTQKLASRRSEKPPKLPPRDNMYPHDIPKPDYDDINDERAFRVKSDKGRDLNKKYGESSCATQNVDELLAECPMQSILINQWVDELLTILFCIQWELSFHKCSESNDTFEWKIVRRFIRPFLHLKSQQFIMIIIITYSVNVCSRCTSLNLCSYAIRCQYSGACICVCTSNIQ